MEATKYTEDNALPESKSKWRAFHELILKRCIATQPHSAALKTKKNVYNENREI